MPAPDANKADPVDLDVSARSASPGPEQTPKVLTGKVAWLRGSLFSLLEGGAAGTLVYLLTGRESISATMFVTLVVFGLRVQARVQRQIQSGNSHLIEKLAESLPGMVYQCRLYPTGRCILTYSNSAIEWIYEKTLEDMKKDCRSILDLVHPDDRRRVWDSLVESALHLTIWKGEYRVILPRQGTRWRFAHAQVDRLSDGGTLWHGFIADVTWRKEIEERMFAGSRREAAALRDAKESAEKADRLKSEFLTMMSHEIRTPLNGVIGFAELLRNGALSAEQQQHVAMIEESGERLLAMVNDTLDLAKIESGSLSIQHESFIIRECVEKSFEMLRPLAEKKNLKYELHIASDTPEHLMGDSMRLSQILTNLLGNAIKFTEKGRVEFRVQVRSLAATGEQSQQWQFVIADTGSGMSPEVLSKLFQLFYQADSSTIRRYEGSGLGLAISQRLARLLGGDITVKSREGEGSEFTLTLATLHTNPQSSR